MRPDGDIALHVEPDNPARFLYEKYGFTNKYLEMRYKRGKTHKWHISHLIPESLKRTTGTSTGIFKEATGSNGLW